LPAPHHRICQLEVQIGRVLHQPTIDFDDFDNRHRKPHAFGQLGRKEVIGQHALMLRIVLELHHVEVLIVGAHQMALSSTAHSLHMLDGLDRQR
jgi:hypothetical protein